MKLYEENDKKEVEENQSRQISSTNREKKIKEPQIKKKKL